MNSEEGSNQDFKGMKKAIGPKSDVPALVETWVCFANAQGGELAVRIVDDIVGARAPGKTHDHMISTEFPIHLKIEKGKIKK